MRWNVDNIIYIYTHKGIPLEINFQKKKKNLISCTKIWKQLSIQTNQKVWVQLLRNIDDNQQTTNHTLT